MPHPETGEILWFRPEPRAVLPLEGFHASKSLLKEIRRADYNVTRDRAFPAVMDGCSRREETWITDEFKRAYQELFSLGHAHSIEIWSQDGKLIGGVYGVHIGGAFFAESKFHTRKNASKIALYHLVKHLKARGFGLLETQFQTPHLRSLGVKEVTDLQYQRILKRALRLSVIY